MAEGLRLLDGLRSTAQGALLGQERFRQPPESVTRKPYQSGWALCRGKPRLGRTSKSGQRDIQRLLIIGAMAVISGAKIRPPAGNSWLGRILARKPRMLAAIALANKMARMLWAMITRTEEFRGGPLLAR